MKVLSAHRPDAEVAVRPTGDLCIAAASPVPAH